MLQAIIYRRVLSLPKNLFVNDVHDYCVIKQIAGKKNY